MYRAICNIGDVFWFIYYNNPNQTRFLMNDVEVLTAEEIGQELGGN